MLAGPDPLVATHVPCDLTQDDLLHNFPWYRGQAERPVVPQVLLTALLVDCESHYKPPVPQHPMVEPIWSHGLVAVQMEEELSNCLHPNHWGCILCSIPDFQIRV